MGRDPGVTLVTVEDAALKRAAAQADEIRRDAHERAERILREARAQAAALIAQRRTAAERLAELERHELLADARAQARSTVLKAQRSVLTQATAAAHAAAGLLIGDSRYQALLEQLSADARERLSPAGLPVELVHVPTGGFVARAGTREIDCSLAARVDRCLREMAGELERLWR
jgi:cell division septum initiation protein DivIVA